LLKGVAKTESCFKTAWFFRVGGDGRGGDGFSPGVGGGGRTKQGGKNFGWGLCLARPRGWKEKGALGKKHSQRVGGAGGVGQEKGAKINYEKKRRTTTSKRKNDE